MRLRFPRNHDIRGPIQKIVPKIKNRAARLICSARSNEYIPIDESGFWRTRQFPAKSLLLTAGLFNQIHGEVIIEIGSGLHGKMSGNSMLVWIQKTNAKRIIAIDFDQRRIDEIQGATQGYSNVELTLADGIDYLNNFSEKIDLLYLDFPVPDPEGTLPGTGRAEAYRNAYNVARDKTNEHSIILIDDTDHIHPWKHTFIVPLAQGDGYSVLYTGRQTLLKR